MATKRGEAIPVERTRMGQVNFRTFEKLVEDFEGAILALSARNEFDSGGNSLSKSWLVEAMICRFLERVGAGESRAMMQELKSANRKWLDGFDERLHAAGGDIVTHGKDVEPPANGKGRKRA